MTFFAFLQNLESLEITFVFVQHMIIVFTITLMLLEGIRIRHITKNACIFPSPKI